LSAADGDRVATSETVNHEDGDQATTVQPGLQNGAAAASAEAQGDVGQLIDLAEDHNVDEENGYRVELRQQTEQSTSTAECFQQLDGTEQVSMRTKKERNSFVRARNIPNSLPKTVANSDFVTVKLKTFLFSQAFSSFSAH